jgi:hypothetical protein
MNNEYIKKRFVRIAKVLQILSYFYIFLGIAISIILPIIFYYIINGNFKLFFSDIVNVIMLFVIIMSFILYFGIVFYFLKSLKKLVFSMQNGEVFTEKNKKYIQKLFKIFLIILSIFFFAVSGGIFLLFAIVFLWVLYEIFFIGFDYKLKNEKLEEENNLTI